MSSAVNRIRIFVASPGDVQEERARVELVINEINRTVAPISNLYVELVRWETHARAGFGADAQDVINQQLIGGDTYPADIFIGIMWKRLGTPTNRAESGTVEEFENAYKAWSAHGSPAILFYFNTSPYYFRTPDEFEQFSKVMQFREDLTGKGGLLWEYQTVEEFESRLREHLTREVIDAAARHRAALATKEESAPTNQVPVVEAPARINNLPMQATRLIGREREVATITDALAARDIRLVTLCGPAGVGKTRTSIQGAADAGDLFEAGVCFVALESVTDVSMIPSVVAEELDVRQIGDQTAMEALTSFLKQRHMLIVLDNFEQLRGGTPFVRELLDACPQVKVIVTTRSRLRVRGERMIEMQPLSIPTEADAHDLDAIGRSSAVQLFVEWAQIARPDFELTSRNAATVAEICRRLDGLPLALELIAARLQSLPLAAILSRLQKNLAMLDHSDGGDGTGPRPLLAAIGSSYELLNPDQKTLFRQLSVFAGGWTIEAMDAVISGDGDHFTALDALIDHSLVRLESESSAEPRYVMLAPIRQYAADRHAEADDADDTRRRHAEYFLTNSEEAATNLLGVRQALWLDRLDQEHGNLRVAIRWSLDANESALALRFGAALWRFWSARGHLSEARSNLTAMLALSGSHDDPVLRARVCSAAAWLAQESDDYDTAISLSEESLAQIELADPRHHHLAAASLLCLGAVALKQGDIEHAVTHWSRSEEIASAANDRWTVTQAILNLGLASMMTGDLPEAKETLQRGLLLARQLGDRFTLVRALGSLGRIALAEGEVNAAYHFYTETLTLTEQLGDRRLRSIALINCGYVSQDRDDYPLALHYFSDALRLSQEIGNRINAVQAIEQIATTSLHLQQYEVAARLFGAADTIRLENNFPRSGREQQEHEETVDRVRQALGDATHMAISMVGQHMTIDDVVALVDEQAAVATG